MINFLRFFAKRTKKTPSSIAINYRCEDKELDRYIHEYYTGHISEEVCIIYILRYIQTYTALQIEENSILFPVIEDILSSAEWKKDWGIECGDYNPQRPRSWLSAVYYAYNSLCFDINGAVEILGHLKEDVTSDNIIRQTRNPYITADMVENFENLQDKQQTLEDIVNAENYAPEEAFQLIKDNWSVMYRNRDAYEAIEYCIVCSKNFFIPPYFDAALRDIGNTLGNKYKELKEKK